LGEGRLPGFSVPRMPAIGTSIGLELCDGAVFWGDMVSVQYPGAGGRHKPFGSSEISLLGQKVFTSVFQGLCLQNFRNSDKELTARLLESGIDHPAIFYGASQVLLQATAHSKGQSVPQCIVEEYELEFSAQSTPIYAQSGDNRYDNTDKMIMKRVDYLPHGLINSTKVFGSKGLEFLDYVEWVRTRVLEKGDENYRPTLYFDLYGMIGRTFSNQVDEIVKYLESLEKVAHPLEICIESAVDFGGRSRHRDGYLLLRDRLRDVCCGVQLAIDEWCNDLSDVHFFSKVRAAHTIHIKMPDLGSVSNSIEAVMVCKKNEVRALLGGSCTETEISARISADIALATQADLVLAKPGMGVDEGIMMIRNQQSRAMSILEARQRPVAEVAS
jgi:methylaspartate ammonia-lyase